MSAEPTHEYLLSLCQQAAALDFGLCIEVDHLDGLRGALYYALKREGLTVEDLGIQITSTPSPHILYILRRSEELPE